MDYTDVEKILLLSPLYETNYWSTALRNFKMPVELLWVWLVKVIRVLLLLIDEQTGVLLTETVGAAFGRMYLSFGLSRLSCICVGHDGIISVYITRKTMLWTASKAKIKQKNDHLTMTENIILSFVVRLDY